MKKNVSRNPASEGTIIPFSAGIIIPDQLPAITADDHTTSSEAECLDIAYSETFSETVCVIDIHGLQLRRPVTTNPTTGHHSVVFDPLAKLWSCLRRRILELWQLSIAGVFTYDIDQEVVSCRFYPDTAAIDHLDIHIGVNTYHAMFAETFPEWAKYFEQHFENWLTAEDGYAIYATMVKEGELDPEKYRVQFNQYLKAHKLRTRADEVRSAAKRRLGETVAN